jgi:hypothetical protein
MSDYRWSLGEKRSGKHAQIRQGGPPSAPEEILCFLFCHSISFFFHLHSLILFIIALKLFIFAVEMMLYRCLPYLSLVKLPPDNICSRLCLLFVTVSFMSSFSGQVDQWASGSEQFIEQLVRAKCMRHPWVLQQERGVHNLLDYFSFLSSFFLGNILKTRI